MYLSRSCTISSRRVSRRSNPWPPFSRPRVEPGPRGRWSEVPRVLCHKKAGSNRRIPQLHGGVGRVGRAWATDLLRLPESNLNRHRSSFRPAHLHQIVSNIDSQVRPPIGQPVSVQGAHKIELFLATPRGFHTPEDSRSLNAPDENSVRAFGPPRAGLVRWFPRANPFANERPGINTRLLFSERPESSHHNYQ